MKKFTILLLLAATLMLSSARAQVVLQDFSAVVGPNTFFHGTWEASGDTGGSTSPAASFVQGAGVYDITGTAPTNGSTSKIEFFAGATPFNIGTHTLLSISAQALAGNVATSFAVTLVDTTGKTAFATFTTAGFLTGSYSTVTGQLTFGSGFNVASIDSMIISGGQPGGTDRFNVSFNNIAAVTAVPEPATGAALAGAGALGFALWRRRRQARCAGASVVEV